MALNTVPVYPGGPLAVFGTLAAATACTTRAPTATASLAGANILSLLPTQTNGCRVDKIAIQACSSSITATTAAQVVTIWEHDGTTAWPIDEFVITAQAPSTTAAAFRLEHTYPCLTLPSTHSLYMSTTVTTTGSTTALCASVYGGIY